MADWLNSIDWKKWFEEKEIVIPQGVYPKIILEGGDAVGKTFLFNLLVSIIKHCMHFHTSAPPKGVGAGYYKNILEQFLHVVKILNQPIIIDRYHIGESVYGSIFRNTNLDYSNIEEELLKHNVKIIYLYADENVVRKRIQERGDWLINESHVSRIFERYDEELKKTKLPVFELDTTNDIMPSDIGNIIKFMYDIK